ncbi:alpha/beta hydrolase family protein [Erythrobacter sp. HA6-11]
MKKLLCALALAALPISSLSAQSEVDEVAAAFGTLQNVLDISLSPDGNKIAYISPAGDSAEALVIIDLAGNAQPKPILRFVEDDQTLSGCDWATNDYMVCRIRVIRQEPGYLLGFSRMVSIKADGSDFNILTESNRVGALGRVQYGGGVVALDLPDDENKILMTRQWVKEFSTGTRLANEKEGFGVERVDLKSARRSTVEAPDPNAVDYVADETGRIRLKVQQRVDNTGRSVGRLDFFYRPMDSERWQPLTRTKVDSQTYDGFYPIAVDSQMDVAFAFGRNDGFEALYTISLSGGGEPELFLAKTDADVDGLVRIGRQRRVVGASYATEKRRVIYTDPEIAAIAKQLSAALPGQPLINIVDASSDETKLLIIASSDTDPGMVYLLDRTAGQLEPLLPVRSYMNDRQLATMTPVSFPAADGTSIPGYLTLPVGSDGKNIPAVVLPHGGPSSRDEWGFDWMVQFFAARGYAVLQPNYRGSSGYGEAWFGRNGFQSWQTAVGDVNDAGRWLVSKGIADPDQLAIVGWSYGGYAALQSQVLDADLYKAVVAIAPVTDLEQLREESMRFTSGRLVDAFIGRGPHVRAGSPAVNAAAFKAPVLLVHGTFDQNVDVDQSRTMKKRLESAGKSVHYMEFEKLAHSLGDSKARYEMLKGIDEFLEENLN